jgi:two-component system sensor histidine kinase DegS
MGQSNDAQALFQYGLDQEMLPTPGDLTLLESPNGKAPDSPNPKFDWIRLSLPLIVNDEIIGYWLIGHRDPDNAYSSEEIALLHSLSTQIGIALTNIEQTETLHALYTANIQEQENERNRLARDLHDNVLNKLAMMHFYLDGKNPEKLASIADDLAVSLRQTVNDLRPPLLDYGLNVALEELLDDVADRIGVTPLIANQIKGGNHRFPLQVEHQVYRIVQQALENALRHAQAGTITVAGQLSQDCIDLTVSDDGIGFDANGETDLTDMLQRHHYGLVGMLERASIIQARVTIASQLRQGTRVHVTWTATSPKTVNPELPPIEDPHLNLTNGKTL